MFSGGFEMKQMLERIMNRYGTRIRWTHGVESREIRAFFQPVTSRSWQKLKREVFPLGQIPTGMYVYIGPEGYGIQEGDFLTVGDREYVLRRAETICDQDGPVYRWGLCARKGRDEA